MMETSVFIELEDALFLVEDLAKEGVRQMSIWKNDDGLWQISFPVTLTEESVDDEV